MPFFFLLNCNRQVLPGHGAMHHQKSVPV